MDLTPKTHPLTPWLHGNFIGWLPSLNDYCRKILVKNFTLYNTLVQNFVIETVVGETQVDLVDPHTELRLINSI